MFAGQGSPLSSTIAGSTPNSGRPVEPGFEKDAPGSVVIMIEPVSVCHQVSTIGQRPPPMTRWYQTHASGLIGSPTLPRRRRLDMSYFFGQSSPQRMKARIAVVAV